MTTIRDKVWTVLASKQELTARVEALVDLINDEKAKSYGIGFYDGQRRRAQLY